MTTTAPQLTEIDHVAIAVHDLEAAIDYYQRAFGATVEHREVVESDGVEEALLKVAESYIQLLTPTREDSPVARALEKRGEGLHHVGYRVADCGLALDAVALDDLTVLDLGAERPAVVVDGGLEVTDGDGDVIDLGEEHAYMLLARTPQRETAGPFSRRGGGTA
jgi:methylmalonyl-CoA epimerase